MLKKLNHLSNELLVSKLMSMKSKENHILAEIILYLSELDSRKYYRELGYSSLFSYCVNALGYSESGAYRRIQAARILKTNPEIYKKVNDGQISLSAIAEVSKVKEEVPRQELLKQSEGKSKKEVELLTLKYQPLVKSKKETIKPKRLIPSKPDLFTGLQEIAMPVAREAFTITIEVDKDFMQLLNEAKELAGYLPTSEIFRKTLKEYLTKRKVIKRQVSSQPKSAENLKTEKPNASRFISKSVKVAVRNRDNNQCCFISEDGKHCSERHGLEFDHRIPYSAGGSSDFSNLRLLCKAHNLLMAERIFGQDKIKAYLMNKQVKA